MITHLGPYELGPNADNQGVYTGDARELAKAIPDESVDLIFTDPPYHKHNAYLFDVLGMIAQRVCKPGALVLSLAGQPALPESMAHLAEHLDYYWASSMPHSLGCIGRYHPRQIMCGGKPFLWYSKGSADPHPYVFDTFLPKRDKRFHGWGQPAEWFMYYLNKLADPSSVIFDPYTGGGTVPAVCKMLGRRWLAFEIDPDVAERARERIRNTQPPLPGINAKQGEMDLS